MLTALCKFIDTYEWGWNEYIMRTVGLDDDLEFPTPKWICIILQMVTPKDSLVI